MATVPHSELVQSLENSGDLAAWINSHLGDDTEDLTDLVEIDRRVGQLATSLEISYQDIANEVEQTLETTTRTIPRVTFELQFMRESTLNLQSTLRRGQQPTAISGGSLANNIDQVLERLRELDLIQENMIAARHILQETESWKSLEAEVTSYLSSNDVASFQRAATRLNEAGKSLSLFQDTPEYEPRKALLTSLENQLEANLSTNLVAAASGNNIVLCRDYYQIFVQINREADFRTYYNGARWSELVSIWNDAKIRDCGELGEPGDDFVVDDFATFFRRFLIAFEGLISEERNLQASIFLDPLESVTSFIQAIFETVSPSLPQRLERLAANRGAEALLTLIESYQCALQFVRSLTSVMEKLALYSSPFTETTGEQAPPSTTKRRRSSRWVSFSGKSISGLPSSLGTKPLTWESSVLEPFLDYQSDYGKLESNFMLRLLPVLDGPQRNKSFSMREREFRELSVDVFSRAEASLQRCSSFTCGYGLMGLVEANQTFLCKFIQSAEQLLANESGSTTKALSPGAAQLTDFDFTVQDWTKLQPCIRLMEVAKAIHERSGSLELKLSNFVVITRKEIQEGTGLQRMSNRGSQTSRPELQLLSQSTLNSVGLQDLLGSLEDGEKQTQAQWILLGQVDGALKSFARRVQAMLSEVILAPLYSHFDTYPSLNCWAAEGRKADSELRTPSFSISPTQIVQHTAEALLKLPGIFEAYADEEALGFCIEFLPYVTSEIDDRHDTEGIDPDEITATWLSSLAVMLLDRFTSEILPRISKLSAEGCKQLAADLDYLSNIVQAFNVGWRDLELWKEFVQMNPVSSGSFMAPDEKADKIFSQVSGLRGWGSSARSY